MYISQPEYQSPIPLHRTPDWKPLVLVFEVVAVLLIFSTVEVSGKKNVYAGILDNMTGNLGIPVCLVVFKSTLLGRIPNEIPIH